MSETRTLVDFLGQRQELREQLECVVSKDYAPISFKSESQTQAGSAKITGQMENGELVVTIERGDATLERRIALKDRAVWSICLTDALAAAEVDAVEIRVIDTESWTAPNYAAQRQAAADGLSRWKLKSSENAPPTVWLLADDGRVERGEVAGDYHVASATAEEAQRLEHLKRANRDLLVFEVDQDIPFPERLRSLKLRLRWSDTPIEQLELEDSRQKIVAQHHAEKQHEVELLLSQPEKVEESPQLPIEDTELKSYLGESEYIRPQDAAIREKALKWLKGAGTALEAVERLTYEVSEYLQGGELVAETLSGPEVLACRKGKCTEYTTLLASLLRSVGVPTRVALGMRLVNGRWIGHMWCEAWVGEWITVDATADEVGGSPALLKLTHSDTVQGTQPARWAMAKSLEVDVLEVERDPQRATGLTTGIVRQSYVNADHACRISAPTPSWNLAEKSGPGGATIRFESPDDLGGGKPLIHFVAFSLPSKLEPSVIINARKRQFASQYQGFEILQDEATTVQSLPGKRFVFRHETKPKEKKIKTTEVVWIHGQSGFLLNLIAEESVHDAALASFEALLESFELLDAGPEEQAE
jgi:transglutaminase-like putative cysteine protease